MTFVMGPNATYIPSPEEVEAGRTAEGGWTRETLRRWGVPWPPPAGWRKRLADEHARAEEGIDRDR
jgi:hypothetical protein